MDKNFAWFLGILLSDGSIIKPFYRYKGDETHLSFICKYSDTEVLYKIKNILNTRANVKSYEQYKSPHSKLRVYDRKDIIQTYYNIKHEIPPDIIGYERHFIRGLIDGDGTLSKRRTRKTFRIGFIDEVYEITQWVSNTICEQLNLPHKNARYSSQNHLYEIMWEGNIAQMIAFWLYHGDIEQCSLKRKLDKYKNDVLDNIIFNNYDLELLKSVKAYIDDNNEIAFCLPSLQTLDWCKRVQKLLSFNTVPVFHNKGRRKYYHLYIPNKEFSINMRDIQTKLYEGIVQ